MGNTDGTSNIAGSILMYRLLADYLGVAKDERSDLRPLLKS